MWKVVHLISVRRKIGRRFLRPGHSDDADEDDAADDNDDDECMMVCLYCFIY